jgi:hypothetical protein
VHVVDVLHYVQLGIIILHKEQIVYKGIDKLSKTYVWFIHDVQLV